MIEKIVIRNGEKVTEVRSDGGKLLFIKTKEGYEMKCPRTKQTCIVKYEVMFTDCIHCLDEIPDCGEITGLLKKKSKD